MTVPRWTAVAVALAGALSAGAGCSGSGPGAEATDEPDLALDDGRWGRIEDEWSGDGPRVAVLGDSLTHQAREELHEALDDHQVRVAAYVGEGWLPGQFSTVHGIPLIETAADDLDDDDPDVVVLALGTNDAWDPLREPPESLTAMEELVERFEGSCLVGVAVNEEATAEDYDQAEAALLNDELADEVDVVVEPTHDGLQPDGIHYRPRGQEAWAADVAEGVERCEE